MASSDVRTAFPLTRVNPVMPGAYGIDGAATETGLRRHSTGAVFYVDTNYIGVRDAAGTVVDRHGTDPQWPLATITQALSKCQPYRGDTIYVMANGFWTDAPKGAANYPLPVIETVEVTVHGVRIVGVFPSSSLGVPWMAAASGDTCLTISAMDVLVEGFCFMGGDPLAVTNFDGIYAEWDGLTQYGDCLTVRHCFFDADIETAITLEFVYNADIHHNVFQGCTIAGIYSDGVSPLQNCHLHHNWFQRVGEGQTGAISVVDAVQCKIDHNQIYNYDAARGVAATNEGINTTGGGMNIVHENVLSCLLPVPAVGDYDDFCSGNAAAPNETDAWIQNYCLDGPSTTNPT